MKGNSTHLVFFVALVAVCVTARAQPIESMKLLSPGAGWARVTGSFSGPRTAEVVGKTLRRPTKAQSSSRTYSSLTSSDPEHGFLLLQLEATSESKLASTSALRLFVTSDGGKNWRQDRSLEHPYGQVAVGASAVVSDSSGHGLVLLAALH